MKVFFLGLWSKIKPAASTVAALAEERLVAESTLVSAKAISEIKDLIKDHDKVALQVGNVLIVKCDGVLQTRTLTARKLQQLESNLEILSDPAKVFAKLDSVDVDNLLPPVTSDTLLPQSDQTTS